MKSRVIWRSRNRRVLATGEIQEYHTLRLKWERKRYGMDALVCEFFIAMLARKLAKLQRKAKGVKK